MPQQTINTPRDTTFKTTENTPRNLADAIAEELHGIAQALDPTADDYDDLSNKPQVNGVTLSGNKTSKQLGIRQTIPLTSAQYAQLSSAEKMDVDKDYIITDANGTIAPIDDDSVSRNKVWSSYKVDDELDTLNSKIATQTYTDANGILFKRCGNVVTISIYGIQNQYVNGATIPEAYRPADAVNRLFTGICTSGSNRYIANIGISSGTTLSTNYITSYGGAAGAISTTAPIYAELTYIIG